MTKVKNKKRSHKSLELQSGLIALKFTICHPLQFFIRSFQHTHHNLNYKNFSKQNSEFCLDF